MECQTGEILEANYFDGSVYTLLEHLFAAGIYPIVYAFIEGAERFSYIESKCSKGMLDFIATRKDRRRRSVETEKLQRMSLKKIMQTE